MAVKQKDSYFSDYRLTINFLNELALQGEYVFRGYSIQEQMLPSVIRNKVDDIEFNLLRDFEKYGAQYFSVSNYFDLVSYAQHYGLSTRLLDFTYNPFIALYFALFKSKPNNATILEDREYYYIRYARISENDLKQDIPYPVFWNELSGEKYGDSLAVKFEKSVKDFLSTYSNTEHPRILFVDPNQANQRMVMQQGLFMLPYTLGEKEHLALIERKTSVIKIHKDLRKELQRYLSTIGIDAFRLMPDLASVCKAIEQKAKEKRKEIKRASKNELQELSGQVASAKS